MIEPGYIVIAVLTAILVLVLIVGAIRDILFSSKRKAPLRRAKRRRAA